MTRAGRILLIILAAAGACRPAQAQEFRVKPDHTVVFGGQHLLPDYLPEFTVLFSAADPQLRMRPAGIPDVQYNVATWLSDRPELNRTDRRADQSGDGFDDEILEGSVESRTADLFNAGRIIVSSSAPSPTVRKKRTRSLSATPKTTFSASRRS